MGFFDMFDRLDDIVYEPIKRVGEWIAEPLNRFQHKRDMEMEELRSERSIEEQEQQVRLDGIRERQRAELDADVRRWNADIDKMVQENEDARRDRLVESIKRYQIDLANATQDIIESIGLMSLSLREKANDLVLEKTQSYMAIQEKVKKESMQEMQEVKEMFFESDPETYRTLISDIMQERRSMVDTARTFIVELSDDLKRLNENSDSLVRESMHAINEQLLSNKHNIIFQSIPENSEKPLLENKGIHEAEFSEVSDT